MSDVINEFLSLSAQRVRNGLLSSSIGVVLGNEAGDLDSVIGSIYLSLLLSKGKVGPRLEGYIPLLNFPKKDLPLRNEVSKTLEHFRIRADLLLSSTAEAPGDLFVDLRNSKSPVVLYDHNTLTSSQRYLASRVIGVVDHHHDDMQYTNTSHSLRLIKPVGSACTLVAQLHKEVNESVLLGEMLAAPILLDTNNFDAGHKKVTPADVAAVEWLTMRGPSSAENATLYQILSKWKGDILALSFADNLRRDYKQFDFYTQKMGKDVIVGISSIPCSFAVARGRYTEGTIAADCAAFCDARGIDSLLLLFSGRSTSGSYTREVAILASSPYLELLTSYVAASPGGVKFTELTPAAAAPGRHSFACYELDDASVSRKRLAPSLAQYLKTNYSSVL